MFNKVQGIVIRTTNYGETNKIVTLYTKEFGKVGVMARGANKPKSRLSSICQLFTHGTYLVQVTSGLGTMQQGEVIESMRVLREDIFLCAYSAYIAELTDKLTEEKKPSSAHFDLLYYTYIYLSQGIDMDVLTFIYEMKMLPAAGVRPNLDACCVCGQKEGTFLFSIKEGGFLCTNCMYVDERAIQISQTTVKLLRTFFYLNIRNLGKVSLKEQTKEEIRLIIDLLYEEYSGVHLKSKRFLKQLQKMDGF